MFKFGEMNGQAGELGVQASELSFKLSITCVKKRN